MKENYWEIQTISRRSLLVLNWRHPYQDDVIGINLQLASSVLVKVVELTAQHNEMNGADNEAVVEHTGPWRSESVRKLRKDVVFLVVSDHEIVRYSGTTVYSISQVTKRFIGPCHLSPRLRRG